MVLPRVSKSGCTTALFVDVITSAAYEAIVLAHDPEMQILLIQLYTSQKISSDIFELIASNLPLSLLESITASNPIYDGLVL